MRKFVFPAIAEKYDEFANYCVSFPDLPGCATTGNTLEECRRNAVKALELHISGMLIDGDEIPAPSPAEALKLNDGELVLEIKAALECCGRSK